MAVVTISRQFGSGGQALGKMIARDLGYQLIDRQIIRRVAELANVSVNWVESVEREAGGRLMPFLSRMVSRDFIERLLADSASDFDDLKYYDFLRRVITDVGAEGDVVIVGQGAQYILPNDKETYKFLLVAEWEDRVDYYRSQYHIDTEKAVGWINREDKKRIAFLYKLEPRDPNDPGLYDLVINTSRVSLEYARRIIEDLVKSGTRP